MSLSPRVLHVLQAVFAQILVIGIRNGRLLLLVVTHGIFLIGQRTFSARPLTRWRLWDGLGYGPGRISRNKGTKFHGRAGCRRGGIFVEDA
jgi:hypothetical protein